MRAAAWRTTVPAVLLALLIGWYAWPEPEEPTAPVEQAQHRIEAELADVAGAFHPGLQWTEARYYSLADTAGFCGTQGCKKTGRAELLAEQWGRVRIGPGKQNERLDEVQKLWTAKGYVVRREQRLLEVKDSQQHLQFLMGADGCAELHVSVVDVADSTEPDGSGGFAQGPPESIKAECATVDDPYWSH
ncbi:hypothetical protein [Kitasatospora sp. NPDC056531]|uniref:hypothetical protein n=1 Tax=Kitasatospora sp. NPDC056531 TaxID=3345856 RepID=UPI0036955A4C